MTYSQPIHNCEKKREENDLFDKHMYQGLNAYNIKRAGMNGYHDWLNEVEELAVPPCKLVFNNKSQEDLFQSQAHFNAPSPVNG